MAPDLSDLGIAQTATGVCLCACVLVCLWLRFPSLPSSLRPSIALQQDDTTSRTLSCRAFITPLALDGGESRSFRPCDVTLDDHSTTVVEGADAERVLQTDRGPTPTLRRCYFGHWSKKSLISARASCSSMPDIKSILLMFNFGGPIGL